jgi:hypothetical protein
MRFRYNQKMHRFAQFLLLVWFSLAPWISPASAAQPTPAFEVRFHPEGTLYVGDQISIEVFTPPGENYERANLSVAVNADVPQVLGTTPFHGTAGQRFRAMLYWVWDTRSLQPGTYTLRFRIPEHSQAWETVVTLQPADPQVQAGEWITTETNCCFVHVIRGTDAERDLPGLLTMIDAQANLASQAIGTTLEEKVHINLVPRILGQGGFTSDEVYISYADGNYANPGVVQLLHHELVHRYDALRESNLRPSLLIEGLAVFLSEGHYQVEPVALRAASLFHTGQYLPLAYLADHFYPAQHEIGYLIGGALVGYMVNRWGWKAFDAFYRDIQPHDAGQAAAIDQALQRHFGLTLQQLESSFTGYLEALPELTDVSRDVDNTVAFFDTVRAYQKLIDPPAYFEQVWLPDAEEMRNRGIVADYLRGPDQIQNLQIEAQLSEALELLDAGAYDLLREKVIIIGLELERIEAQ